MRELYSKQDRDRLDAAKAEWWKNYAEGAVEVDEVIVKYLAEAGIDRLYPWKNLYWKRTEYKSCMLSEPLRTLT